MLPAEPGGAPALLSSPVVFTEEITKARDSHNLSVEEQLVSLLSYTHGHLQPGNISPNQEQIPFVCFILV